MVSVIIPNYNNSKYLKNCVESIIKNCHMKIEIIIVDNKSTDDSLEVVKKLLKVNKNIRLYALEENRGFSYAVNFGIKNSIYDYVFLLNNDTEIEENSIENLYVFIKKDENIFSVNSLMIRMDEKDIVDDAGDYFTVMSVAYKGYDGYSVNSKPVKKIRRIFSSCGGASIYRKKIFEKIGYFDESFFAYLEDVDISYRANINGYKNYFLPYSKIYHKGSLSTGGKYNSFKVRQVGKNTVFLIYKNMPVLQLIFNLPFILFGMFVKYIFYRKKGYEKDFIDGMNYAFSNIKSVKKTGFKITNILNYIKIEFFLFFDTIRYFVMRLNRR